MKRQRVITREKKQQAPRRRKLKRIENLLEELIFFIFWLCSHNTVIFWPSYFSHTPNNPNPVRRPQVFSHLLFQPDTCNSYLSSSSSLCHIHHTSSLGSAPVPSRVQVEHRRSARSWSAVHCCYIDTQDRSSLQACHIL